MSDQTLAPPTSRSAPRFSGFTLWLNQHRLLSIIIALAILVGLIAAFVITRSQSAVTYTTQAVVQQDLTQSVTASGTVNPQNTVSIGSQASGTISEIYVDFNSKVHKGEVLARIDPSQIQAQLDQAQANLAQAQAQTGVQSANAQSAQSGIMISQAGIATARSNVTKAQSALTLANQTLARDKALVDQGFLAQNQYDTDASAAVAAQTALAGAQAALIQAGAQSSQSRAQAVGTSYSVTAQHAAAQAAAALVSQDEYNLSHSIITSPVDGTVVARNVSVGQTVAASFQTPTLFTIAQDLRKMEVDISVGESDIGNVHVGDSVAFTVLAFQNQTFHGIVSQVRVNPTTISNVVTYDVVTLVNNPNNQLLPGMTANATITIATARNALIVPAQALTWRPAIRTRSTAGHKASTGSSSTTASGSPWGTVGPGVASSTEPGASGIIFIKTSAGIHGIPVKVLLASGTQVAVLPLRGTLHVGDSVVLSSSLGAIKPAGPPGASPINRRFHP